MPHLLPRPSSAGCALVLLTALGPASGTPAGGSAAPPAAPAPVVQTTAVDSSRPAPVLIPCISGMCEVPLYDAAALTPAPRTGPAPSGGDRRP
jgi:hypothetical protein